MHVPKYLLFNVVLSTCYLINRMLSSVLHGKVLFSCLYPHKSVFFITLRVFCCICCVQDLSIGLDNLSPRSLKCVLVGYSWTLKGYRCYSPSNMKYFISVDITFFESVSYFSPQSLVTASEPIPFSQHVLCLHMLLLMMSLCQCHRKTLQSHLH